MSNIKKYKTYVGWFGYVLCFGLFSKLPNGEPFVSMGLASGAMIGMFIWSSRQTLIGNYVGCVLGFAVLDLLVPQPRPILGLQLMMVCLIGAFVFWRRWAEIPDDAVEPSSLQPQMTNNSINDSN